MDSMKTNICGKCDTPHVMYGGKLQCRPCRQRMNKAYYHNNKERVLTQMTSKLYGITKSEASEFRARTECEVCGGGPRGKGLHIDHNHATGLIRGVLCHGCNLALGNVEDNPERLRALAEYLERSQ